MQTVAPDRGYSMVAGHAGALPALLALALMLTVAVYVELKERRIPNWLTFSGMACGLLIGTFHGKVALWASISGLAIGFIFLFVFYVFRGVGGGDVKLMAAAGALMGGDLIKPALIYTSILGAFLALLLLIWRKDFWSRLGRVLRPLAFWRKIEAEPPAETPPVAVPYGLAIAAGCVLALVVKGAS